MAWTCRDETTGGKIEIRRDEIYRLPEEVEGCHCTLPVLHAYGAGEFPLAVSPGVVAVRILPSVILRCCSSSWDIREGWWPLARRVGDTGRWTDKLFPRNLCDVGVAMGINRFVQKVD